MHRLIAMAFICFLSFAAAKEVPKKYTFTAGNNTLVWKAKGKALVGNASSFDITGRGGFVEGEVSLSKGFYSGALNVDVTGFKTEIEKRDKHLQEYLDSKQFPLATLMIKKLALGSDAFEGDLKIKGVSKPVSGTFSFKDDNLKAAFKVKVSDYPIGKVSYLGFGIEDEIAVEVDAHFIF